MADKIFTAEVSGKQINLDPLHRPFEKRFPEKVDVVVGVGQKPTIEKIEVKKSPHLKKMFYHGRNFTKLLDQEGKHMAFWMGENPADKFGESNTKGINMDIGIDVEPYDFSKEKVHTLGLMENSLLPRVVKASEVLRKNGLPTERIGATHEINEVFVRDSEGVMQKISIDDFKKMIIEKIDIKIEECGVSDIDYRNELIDYRDRVRQYFNKNKFISIDRDVQCDTRLKNIQHIKDDTTLSQTMKPILNWLNVQSQYKNEGLIPGTPRPEPFTTSDSDLIRYFEEWYPENIGIYLGKLRNFKLTDGYLDSGNLQALPTILDLDSLSGKLIFPDDENPTMAEYALDLFDVSGCLIDLWKNFEKHQLLGDINYQNNLENAVKNYFSSYFKETFGDKIDRRDIQPMIDQGKLENRIANKETSIKVLELIKDTIPPTNIFQYFVKKYL